MLMSKKQLFIGGFVGFIAFSIPISFILLSIFSSGFSQIIGMILSFLCFIVLLTRDFKELGAELSKLKFWIRR